MERCLAGPDRYSDMLLIPPAAQLCVPEGVKRCKDTSW